MKPEPVKQQSSIKPVNYNIVVLLIKFAALAAVGLLKKQTPHQPKKPKREQKDPNHKQKNNFSKTLVIQSAIE